MRERVTYILRNPKADFDPSQLKATDTTFEIPGLEAVKEHQITFDANELPAELSRILRNCHELHIRWATPWYYKEIAPFVSRVTPGLHVFFTPLQGRSAKRLCSLLKTTFGEWIKCDSVEGAFTTPKVLSKRFASSSARQYFQYVPSIYNLVAFIQMQICGEDQYPCRLRAHDLQWADYLDIDYDAVSHAFVLRAFWSQSRADDAKWYETHLKGIKSSDTLEVGVLMNEISEEEEELRYSGFLTQVGRDKKPSPTLFSFPSRHHPLPESHTLTYNGSFNTPTSMHPTLSLKFSTVPKPPHPSCALHAYLTLPSTLFIDKYPFSDPLFLAQHNLAALHSISGATDLEAPEWVVPAWGSASLLEIALPESEPERKDAGFTATIPLHLRYLAPANVSHIFLHVPWPAVFFSCPSASSGSKLAAAPFDRANLGYDGLMGSTGLPGSKGTSGANTIFYHVPPSPPGATPDADDGRAASTLMVPVMDLRKTDWVEWGTMGAVLLGTIWLLYVLRRVVKKRGFGSGKSEKKN